MRTAIDAASRRMVLGAPSGGMLIVGGPPLEGKGVLAARLEEVLPYAIRLGSADNLAEDDETWFPEGPAGRAVREPCREMLRVACSLLSGGRPGPGRVVVLSARFGTREARSLASEAARSAGARLLLVEARSSQIRALRRLSSIALSAEQVAGRIDAYARVLRRYEPMTRDEAKELPGLRLRTVLRDLDGAVRRVLGAWAAR